MVTTIAEDASTNRSDQSIRDLEHQHGHVGEPYDSLGHATEHEPRDAAAAMRGYYNQIGTDALGPIDASRPWITDQDFFGALSISRIRELFIERFLGVLQTDLVIDRLYRETFGCQWDEGWQDVKNMHLRRGIGNRQCFVDGHPRMG